MRVHPLVDSECRFQFTSKAILEQSIWVPGTGKPIDCLKCETYRVGADSNCPPPSDKLTLMNVKLRSNRFGETLIAEFGKARLTKDFSGRFALTGGNQNDRQEAREWVSFFLHEAVIDVSRETKNNNSRNRMN